MRRELTDAVVEDPNPGQQGLKPIGQGEIRQTVLMLRTRIQDNKD